MNSPFSSAVRSTRRSALLGGLAVGTGLLQLGAAGAAELLPQPRITMGVTPMDMITTKDNVSIFYKDWGSGQPIVFSHGWPLSADDWDAQMLFFLGHGYRVIAHDRRGHGRSTQVADGHDMDHYADDLAALTAYLDLKDAIHVGHSTGGGEVARYLGRHGESRVAKAALVSAVPPLMVKTAANPLGLPKQVFDGLQAQLAANRSQFYRDLPAGPFYGYNRPGAKTSEAVIENWWRQGMMGGAKAHYDGIVAFSQTDFTEDLKKITVPVLVMHSEDDQIVPYVASGPQSAKLLKNGTLKTYKDFPHGMPTTEAETINADLLAFIKG
jgi:non-heme chloroperoxidase